MPSSPKTALFIAGEFPPVKTIGRIRTVKFIEHLRAHGWAVIVLTVEPGNAADPALLDEIPPGTAVHRVANLDIELALVGQLKRLLRRSAHPERLPALADDSAGTAASRPAAPRSALRDGLLEGFKQLLRQGVYVPDSYLPWAVRAQRTALELCRTHPIDLIYTTLPPFSAALIGYRLKKATGLPWVVDYRDLWYGDVLREWIGPVRRRLELRLERHLMQKADAIITVSEQKTAYLQRLLPTIRPRWATLTNGYDPEIFTPLRQGPRPVNDTIDFVYTGRLFKNRRGYAFAEALGQLSREQPALTERVRVHILGGVSPEIRARYDQILDQYGIADRFDFAGDVPYRAAMRAQVETDYLLLIVDTGETSDGVIPGKLFEYVAARRPLFALCDPGATQTIIERGRLGRVVPAEDVAQCKTALAEVLAQPVPATLDVDEDYLNQFDRRHISQRLAALFDELTAGR